MDTRTDRDTSRNCTAETEKHDDILLIPDDIGSSCDRIAGPSQFVQDLILR